MGPTVRRVHFLVYFSTYRNEGQFGKTYSVRLSLCVLTECQQSCCTADLSCLSVHIRSKVLLCMKHGVDKFLLVSGSDHFDVLLQSQFEFQIILRESIMSVIIFARSNMKYEPKSRWYLPDSSSKQLYSPHTTVAHPWCPRDANSLQSADTEQTH